MAFRPILIALSLLFSAQAVADPVFDYTALKKLVIESQAKSPEDVIGLLPREYLENYILFYMSREIPTQPATAEKPRAELYGTGKSGLVITFNGSGKGSQDIELEQYDFKTRQSSFNVITFPGSEGGNSGASVIFKDGVSHKKSGECIKCHFDERPIWEGDRVPGAFNGRPEGMIGNEKESFARFVANYRRDPRYRHLIGLEDGGKGYLARRPASEMSDILLAKNEERLSRVIAELPGYEQHRAEIAAAFSGVPIEDRWRGDFSSLLADTRTTLSETHRSLVKLTSLFSHTDEQSADFEDPCEKDAELISRLRLVFEKKMGLEMKNWASTFRVNSFSFANSSGTRGLHHVIRNLEEWDPQMKEIMNQRTDTFNECVKRNITNKQ